MLVVASPSDTEFLAALARREDLLAALRESLGVLGPHPVMRILGLSRALVEVGDATLASTLVDAAEQIRDRSAPAGTSSSFPRLAHAGSLAVDACAAMIDPTEVDGELSRHLDGGWYFSAPRWGRLVMTRGHVSTGFAARVSIVGHEPMTLCFGVVDTLLRELGVESGPSSRSPGSTIS